MMNKKTVCNSREKNHTITMLIYIVDVRTKKFRISDKTNTIYEIGTHEYKQTILYTRTTI